MTPSCSLLQILYSISQSPCTPDWQRFRAVSGKNWTRGCADHTGGVERAIDELLETREAGLNDGWERRRERDRDRVGWAVWVCCSKRQQKIVQFLHSKSSRLSRGHPLNTHGFKAPSHWESQ